MALTKRTVFFLILSIGIGMTFALILVGEPPLNGPTLTSIAAQMTLFAAISAALGVARTPGRWGEKVERGTVRQRTLPRWLSLTLFAVLAQLNYLVALAVALGNLPFAPRRPIDPTEFD